MGPMTRDYQQMAVAILAIGTAALGFALWQQDFDLTYPKGRTVEVLLLYWVIVSAPFVAAVFYFLTFITAGELIGRPSGVTGLEVVRRPVVSLYCQMATLSILFFAKYVSDLIVAVTAGGAAPCRCLQL